MYREEIKKILKNTYDVCAHTLDFGLLTASRRNKGELFFYSLDKDDKEEILTLRNILESQFPKTEKSYLTELKQPWKKTSGNYRSVLIIMLMAIMDGAWIFMI